ncbi:MULTISPECIES: hypothetical protein [Okeania]|nr:MULTISPECIES: hypothetical protein [Okeania]
MAVKKNTKYEKFLAPLVSNFLIYQEAMELFRNSMMLGGIKRSPH